MNKLILSTSTFLLPLYNFAASEKAFITSNYLFIQAKMDLVKPFKELLKQLKQIFPIIATILFIVVVFINIGEFTKDNGDWKKGIFKILIFLIAIGIVSALVANIEKIKI